MNFIFHINYDLIIIPTLSEHEIIFFKTSDYEKREREP